MPHASPVPRRPRHFQFDRSGQWLIVANQDSDDCAVFNFNVSTGHVAFTGNSFKCPSPNFVCVWDGA
jgi:6-phosphogluconolactonase (cycloisomerase 2 family)